METFIKIMHNEIAIYKKNLLIKLKCIADKEFKERVDGTLISAINSKNN